MPYVIKRYANRKLYDTRTKRYLTLDEIAVLVRAGEDVRVEDADTAEDLTGSVLAKIISESSRKGGAIALPQKLLSDLIQRPSETVLGAVRTSVTAGQHAVEQVGTEVGKLFESVKGVGERGAHRVGEAGGELAGALEERFATVLAGLNLPTRAEMASLAKRVESLEKAAAKRVRRPAAPSTPKTSGSGTAKAKRPSAAKARSEKAAARRHS
jgi:polyhydroxyalkanoate synthesis repressor PhaR